MNLLVTELVDRRLERLRDRTDRLDLTDYVHDTSERTSEAFERLIDVERIRHAQRFFATFGLPITASLLFKALPESYAAARGAQVLSLTGELVSAPARRVRQTAQFLITMMTPSLEDRQGGRTTTLHPGQPGAIVARRLRVMHAQVRHFVLTECPDRWKSKEESYFDVVDPHGPSLGAPLNQEDLIGMLHEFSVGVFEGLDVLGVPATAADKAAWFHLWNVVGCHMGIGTDDALRADGEPAQIHRECQFALPLDPTSSAETMAVIRRRHWQASFEGSILVNALLADLERALPRSLKPYPAALMRYLLGDDTANLLGIARGGWFQQALLTANSWRRVADTVRSRHRGAPVRLLTSELSATATQRVLQSYVEDAERDGPPFELASSFRNTWGIGSRREPKAAVPPFAIERQTA
jgi:hypothetical protein